MLYALAYCYLSQCSVTNMAFASLRDCRAQVAQQERALHPPGMPANVRYADQRQKYVCVKRSGWEPVG